jgi:electron transport complex protein RnfE
MNRASSFFLEGLWSNNPVLVQLLGLCPLLAVTTTVVNGFVLGIATTAVVFSTNILISLLRNSLVPVVRIPLFVLVIAAFVTTIDLLMNALLHDLHRILGLFVPLIITNCAILAQAETVASRQPVGVSAAAALGTGLGFGSVLVLLGAMREIVGQGTLFSGFDMLLGESAAAIEISLPFDGMLAAVLPPGAFFGLAVLLAIRNSLIARRAAVDPAQGPTAEDRSEVS